MHIIRINEKRGHKFVGEKERVCGKKKKGDDEIQK